MKIRWMVKKIEPCKVGGWPKGGFAQSPNLPVYRTAPATLGLLITSQELFLSASKGVGPGSFPITWLGVI